MRVKKFLARTLPEAVAQVKAELGPEAIILHTQPVKIGGVFGLFSQRMIEVTAAAEPAAPVRSQQRPGPAPSGPLAPLPAAAPAAAATVPPAPPARPEVAAMSAQAAATGGAAAPLPPAQWGSAAARAVAPPAPAETAGETEILRQEVEKVSDLVGRVLERMDPPGADRLEPLVRPVYTALVERGVDGDLAVGVARKVQTRLKKDHQAGTLLGDVAREVLERQLGLPETISLTGGARRVVALMGPTGVGKTTTLAKLAAFWALRKRVRVALMTADTYRIAAVEQLRTYCEIIGVPLEVVEGPDEVADALERHRAADLILVDTAGRSHRNPVQMEDLARYMAALRPDESYLVLSLTTSSPDSLAVAEAYGAVGYDRLLFTKLDEAVAPGTILNVLTRHKKPLSYVTTGQNVPDDIEVAGPERLSRILLGDGV